MTSGKPLRILFVDDNSASVEPLQRHLEREVSPEPISRIINFEDYTTEVALFNPDLVILDLLDSGGTAEPESVGTRIFDSIWQHEFCPIVVYSSQPELLEDAKDHPFVRRVKKGTNSTEKVYDIIMEFTNHINSIQEARTFVNKAFSIVLRDVAPHAFRLSSDQDEIRDAILRAGRRRLAASMDISSLDKTLASWEQYLFPPMSVDCKLGDIIMRSEGNKEDPSDFYIVLTPSCDMVNTNGRSPKVEKILLARCVAMSEVHKQNSIKLEAEKWKTTCLTPGFIGSMLPMPPLLGMIPAMAADMKKLELLPLSDIGISYIRIASVDSPFKELVSWAYMQVACRPGLPERALDAWACEIVANLGAK